VSDRPASHPFLDAPWPLALAHQGHCIGELPPNTIRAFRASVDLGYRYLETDVQVTKDGVALVFHDDSLDRLTDRTGLIRDLPYREVRQARVHGTDPIPTLDELFETFAEQRINLDAKNSWSVQGLVTTIQRQRALDRVCVGAFSGADLKRVRRLLGPGLCTSAGPGEVTRAKAASLGLPVWPRGPRCYQVPVRFERLPVGSARFITAAQRRGYPVHIWTVNDEAEMDRLLDLGVAGIMTDDSALLKQVLERRGQWH
jgi:glycerophosphoryl diester phosphodiesterase